MVEACQTFEVIDKTSRTQDTGFPLLLSDEERCGAVRRVEGIYGCLFRIGKNHSPI